MENQVSEIMRLSLDNLRELIDVNVIVGKEIQTDKGSIIPVSKVKCSFVGGGMDQKKYPNDLNPTTAATLANITITPVAFIVASDEINLLHIDEASHNVEKVIDLIGETIKRLTKKDK